MSWITTILKFLNDNLGAVTFVVGFLAIYLYLKQRRDRKRDAARLILQEIRYAEQQIRNFRIAQSYSLASKLLPRSRLRGSSGAFYMIIRLNY
jgi:type II secretory pathway component PulF